MQFGVAVNVPHPIVNCTKIPGQIDPTSRMSRS